MKKIILSAILTLSLLIPNVYAEIPFTQTRLAKMNGVSRRVINTGMGCFVDTEDSRILYSKDKTQWEDVTDKIPDSIQLYNGSFPMVEIIETDDKFIICNTPFTKGEAYDRTGRLIVTDKDFNIIKDIQTDRISDISYIGGVCYINKYLDYVGEPGQDVSNVVIEQASYYSDDFENWQIYKEDGGIPVVNGNKELFIKTDLVHIPDLTSIRLPFLEHTKAVTAVSSNSIINQDILYESENLQSLAHINDYFIGVPENSGVLPISKDGVYFTNVELPTTAKLRGLYELDNGNLEFYANDNLCCEFSVEDIENTIRTGDIYVQFQNKILGFEQPPVIEDGRTLVPMRFIFEQMGAEVDWNGETRTVTATKDGMTVTLEIDNINATVNGEATTLDVPARLINDKTMIPLRFLSENLGYTVDWDADSRTAIIE